MSEAAFNRYLEAGSSIALTDDEQVEIIRTIDALGLKRWGGHHMKLQLYRGQQKADAAFAEWAARLEA